MSTGVDYRYLIADCSTGKPVCELPVYGARFTRVLSGIGEFTGQIPLDHPKATRANFNGDREVTVLRNSVPVWNGPIVHLNPRKSSGMADLTARDAFWYLLRRVDNAGRAFLATTDLFDLVRTLVTYATGKTGGSLYQFNVSSAAASETLGSKWAYVGSKLYIIGQIIQDLGASPTNGFDFRMDFSGGQSVTRTLNLGAPSLGGTKTEVITEHMLKDYGEDYDRERAGNVIYARGGNGDYVSATNSSSLTAGDILLEQVVDVTHITKRTVLTSWANEHRRLWQPPVTDYTITYVPDGPPSPLALAPALPYGWCNLGDSLNLQITQPDLLKISDHRRVQQIETIPPDGAGAQELVNISFNLPLDRLGS